MVSPPSSFEIPLDAFLEDSGNLDLADTAAVRAHGLRTLPFHPELVFRLSRNAVEVSGTAEQVEKTKEIARLAGECESLYRDGNAGEVVKLAARVLDANPAYRFARVQLITSLGQLERYDDAMDALLEGLRLDPLYPLYHLHMAALLYYTNAADDLIEQYAQRAKELNAPTFWPDLLLCMVALKQERYADLLALSSEALNAHPDSPELLYHHAVALDHIGRYQDAIGKFEKMMRHATPETLLPGDYYIVDEIYLSCVQEAARENAPAVQTAVRRETARLESEFGWEVIFEHEAKGWNPDEERDLELPRKIHWVAEKPPGIVEVRLGEEHDFSCYEELRALTEVRKEAAALQANPKNNRPVRLQQAVANMANEWFVLPDDCEANPENLPIMRNIFEWGLEMPLGWLACHRQMERYSESRFGLLKDMIYEIKSYAEIVPNPEEESAPPFVAILCGAGALILSDLSTGILNFTDAYRNLPEWPRSQQIRDHFRLHMERGIKPGAEMQLVTEIARIAGIIPSPPIHTKGMTP